MQLTLEPQKALYNVSRGSSTTIALHIDFPYPFKGPESESLFVCLQCNMIIRQNQGTLLADKETHSNNEQF